MSNDTKITEKEVFIIVAVTADGFIAKDKNHFADWTSKEDKKRFIEKTKDAQVVIMGSTTYNTIGRPLKNRVNIVYTSNKIKIAESLDKIINLKSSDVIDLQEPLYTDKNPSDLLQKLFTQGFDKVAICGGSSIYSMFLDNDLVDKIYLTIEPVLFGQGINVFGKNIEMASRMVLEKFEATENGTVFLDYVLVK